MQRARGSRSQTRVLVLLVLALGYGSLAQAHGGVMLDDDICLINIGFFQAHFKIYQPQSQRFEEFCEDLPAAESSVFVMEYQHDGLAEMAVDFRIIRDVTGMGLYANWDDIQAIENLQDATVFYQPERIDPDLLTIVHAFAEAGLYIGIVTATHLDNGKTYAAVFPFEVGYQGIGYWPWLVVLLAALTGLWWLMNRGQRKEFP